MKMISFGKRGYMYSAKLPKIHQVDFVWSVYV